MNTAPRLSAMVLRQEGCEVFAADHTGALPAIQRRESQSGKRKNAKEYVQR